MGWGMNNVDVRKVSDGIVFKPFRVASFHVDTCASSAARITLRYGSGTEKLRWFEVILPHDDARTRYIKWDYSKKVLAARELASAAKLALKRLEG